MCLRYIFLIQALQISTVSMLCFDLGRLTLQDNYLERNLLGTTSSVSVTDCAVECQSYKECKSFGFEPQTRSCHLHYQSSVSAPSDLVTKTNWIHGNVNEWPETLWGPCAEHNCPEGQKCHVNRLTKDQICVTGTLTKPQDVCPVPPEVTNAVLSPGGQAIGASRTYTCQDEYLDTQSFLTSAVTTCLPDNTWAPVSLTCSGPYLRLESPSAPAIGPDDFARLTGSTSSLIFLVKTCSSSIVRLVASQGVSIGQMYEVIIGGWENTWSVIREDQTETGYVSHEEKGLLSCTRFRPFWISLAGGYINVGKGNTVDENEFLSWDRSMVFNYASVSTYGDREGVWYFLVQ